MRQLKKMTGKGHTLYQDKLPQSPQDVWVLVAESCYEISKTLLSQHSYAEEIYFSLSGYNSEDPRGGVGIRPNDKPRYPEELYQALHCDQRVNQLIKLLFEHIRRVQVRTLCAPYVQFLFDNKAEVESRFEFLERVRKRLKDTDIIGVGLEGCRSLRLQTYTPKRSVEVQRAYAILSKKPHLLDLLNNGSKHPMGF